MQHTTRYSWHLEKLQELVDELHVSDCETIDFFHLFLVISF